MRVVCQRCACEEDLHLAAGRWVTLVVPELGVRRRLCDCCASELLEALKPPWAVDKGPRSGEDDGGPKEGAGR